MIGYFQISRGLFDHDLFTNNKPLSDFEAWIWLIEHANYAPQQFRSGYKTFSIPRGALATHYRSLAKEWRWDHKKVIRFLNMAKKESMIALETTHKMVHITLCNYDKYQKPWDKEAPNLPQISPKLTPKVGTKRIKEINANEGNEDNNPLPPWMPIPEWEAFKEMRKRIKHPMSDYAEKLAINKLGSFLHDGLDIVLILNQSVLNDWKDLYEPKKGNGYDRATKIDLIAKGIAEARIKRRQDEQGQAG